MKINWKKIKFNQKKRVKQNRQARQDKAKQSKKWNEVKQ